MQRIRLAALGGLIYALLPGAACNLYALNPQKALTQYTRTIWTQAQGLPQDTIRAIAQTTDGYLWVGTSEGLARFDGYEFLTFTKDGGSLPSNSVGTLAAGRDGSLWIGTSGGLARYADGRFKIYTAKDGVKPRAVTAVAVDHTGALWFSSGGVLIRLENDKITTFGKQRLAPIGLIRQIYEDSEGQLWLGGAGALLLKKGDNFSIILGPRDLNGSAVTGIVKDKTGVWLSGTKGIIWMRPDGTRKRFDVEDGLPDHLVRAMHKDRDGNLWAGTNGGLSRLENGRFVTPQGHSKSDSESVWSLIEDREGDLWVGKNSSLNRLRDDRFTIYGLVEGLPSDEPMVAHQDRRGQLWLGYHENGLVAFGIGHSRVYSIRDGLASNEIFSIRDAANGDLLIGTRNGLSRMHEGRFSNYVVPDPQGRKNVYDAIEDARGNLWVATSSGVYESHGESWRSILQGDPGGTGYAAALTAARDGSVWVGMFDSGLWRIVPGGSGQEKPRRYATAGELGTDQIRSVAEDAGGTLWIGTFGGGLSSFRDGVFHRYAARDGLLTDNVSHVQDDGKGDLWLSTPRGICRLEKRQLKDFSAGTIHALSPINYGIQDGLRSAQCAPGFPVGGGPTLTSDGRLWFPTGSGLATIDPSAPEPHAPPQGNAPITKITELTVDGHAVDLNKPARLNPGTGSVQFRYAGIYLNAPERVRYAYKLDGLDRDWISAANRRVINYNTLPHGRYRFAVRAMVLGGGADESEFSFEVLPHIYEMGWFLGLCGVSLLGLIYCAYQFRLRSVRSRFGLVLEERARLAREIHDTLAQGFVGISSQLDALAMKLDGDAGVARQHLDLARKMARHSLTEARRSVMDLRTLELEDRDLPAALTALAHRWVAGSPVSLQLDVSGVKQKLPEDLEQNVLRIAQEAVANALKHAHAHAIWIELTESGGNLRLSIKDDGRGFEPSTSFSVIGGHFGILGMRERARRLGGEFVFASHVGGGTEVEVRVPLGSTNGSRP